MAHRPAAPSKAGLRRARLAWRCATLGHEKADRKHKQAPWCARIFRGWPKVTCRSTTTCEKAIMAMREVLEQLVRGEDLSAEMARGAMEAIATGEAEHVQTAAFLALLAAKGETAAEIAALAGVMRQHAERVDVGRSVVDVVGTGGDGHDTINISTSAAILSAACGASVAKHGSTSVSSRSGSSDVLEKLGIKLLGPDHIKACLDEAGIAFMFAPKFHPAMKHVVPVRKALQIRTVFNILGPLLNPADAKHLMLGVYKPSLLDTYAEAVHALGAEHALVVHCCGLDELASVGVAEAREITREGGVRKLQVDPQAMGLAKCEIADLKGGSPEENAAAIRNIFAGGEAAKGPIAETIALNAGAVLYVSGLAPSIEEGMRAALAKLQSGEAIATLDKFAAVSSRLFPEPAPKQPCA